MWININNGTKKKGPFVRSFYKGKDTKIKYFGYRRK